TKEKTKEDLLSAKYTPAPLKLVPPPTQPLHVDIKKFPSLESLGFDPMITKAMQKVIEKCHQSSSSDPPSPLSIQPTEIQILTAQHFFKKRDKRSNALDEPPIVLAAETGSGKTLAYLSCLMQQLKRDEQKQQVHDKEGNHSMALRRLEKPRAIVLVPTLDLVHQVGDIAKWMSHEVKLRTLAMSHGMSSVHMKRKLKEPIDLLITTPATLQKQLRMQRLGLAETQYVVLDEADFLIDQGFAEETKATFQLLKKILQTRGRTSQIYCVSATVPSSLLSTLNAWWVLPNSTSTPSTSNSKSKPRSNANTPLPLVPSTSAGCQVIATSHMHRTVPQCEHVFIQARDPYQSLLHVLQTYATPYSHGLIFCNTRESVPRVVQFLINQRVPHVYGCVGQQTMQERQLTWKQFHASLGGIMVCTDLVARGLDTLTCQFMVNFEFPLSIIEFVHRIGRTARAGKKGKAIHLVTKRNSVLVKAIQQRLKLKKDFSVV
ncbi:hypothetical protein HMI56_005027, partial [Coelomomyces lativittatus]